MSDLWDAPNQQVVRPDQSAPWQEGTGGSSSGETSATAAKAKGEDDLSTLTHAELLAQAQEIGASPANRNMTKDELVASIEAKQQES